MENEIIALDVAEEIKDFSTLPQKAYENYKAVLNTHSGKVAAFVSKGYSIIQHRDVASSAKEACNELGLNNELKIGNYGNRMNLDVEFPDLKIEVGETFLIGFRMINSYDKTTGITIVPRFLRLACSNGMIVTTLGVPEFHYRHNQKLALNFKAHIEVALSKLIISNDRLKELVNKCMKDSVEWETCKKLLEYLFQEEKHRKAIEKELDVEGEITRWDIYNAVTRYATHNEHLSPYVEDRMNNKAEKLLTTPLQVLIATIPEQKGGIE